MKVSISLVSISKLEVRPCTRILPIPIASSTRGDALSSDTFLAKAAMAEETRAARRLPVRVYLSKGYSRALWTSST